MAQIEVGNHPNIELVRNGHAAYERGDIEAIRESFDPNIVWHLPGNNQFTGDYKGIGQLFEMFARDLQWTGGTEKNDIHDILANDDHTVVLGTHTAEHDGKKLKVRFVHVQHIRDGKVTESWMFTDDQAAVDDFYS